MLHTIQNDRLTVCVDELGAQLMSIRGNDGTEYLWQGDPTYWKDRAPNIFPYVARLVDKTYMLDGNAYQMEIHGFAKQLSFTVGEKTDTVLQLELCDSPETLAQYPRRFRFMIRYALQDDTLQIGYRVENRDEKALYFGVGGHPGFCVPMAEGLRFEDYRLTFGEACEPIRIGFSDDHFCDGSEAPYPLAENRVIPLQHDLFDDDAIVMRNMSDTVTLHSDLDPHSVTVHYPNFTYLGIWHKPKSDAPYVCIEPWSSLPATQGRITTFEAQPDLICLPAGEVLELPWSIRLQ